ncbi:hypothetical protein Dimus_020016 [Dionaea muscipula]
MVISQMNGMFLDGLCIGSGGHNKQGFAEVNKSGSGIKGYFQKGASKAADNQRLKQGFSYVDAVQIGGKQPLVVKVHSIGNGWLYRSVVATFVDSPRPKILLESFIKEEGNKVMVRRMGIKQVLVTFPSKDAMSELLGDKQKWVAEEQSVYICNSCANCRCCNYGDSVIPVDVQPRPQVEDGVVESSNVDEFPRLFRLSIAPEGMVNQLFHSLLEMREWSIPVWGILRPRQRDELGQLLSWMAHSDAGNVATVDWHSSAKPFLADLEVPIHLEQEM